jgi:hypothetical protein
MILETRQQRVDRLTKYYVKLVEKDGLEPVIRFLREVIESHNSGNKPRLDSVESNAPAPKEKV